MEEKPKKTYIVMPDFGKKKTAQSKNQEELVETPKKEEKKKTFLNNDDSLLNKKSDLMKKEGISFNDKLKEMKNDLMKSYSNSSYKTDKTDDFKKRIESIYKRENTSAMVLEKNSKTDFNSIKNKIKNFELHKGGESKTVKKNKDVFDDLNSMLDNFKNKRK